MISQDGAIVLVETDGKVIRVNQSKVRLTHDEWHDVPDPLQVNGGNSHELVPHPAEGGSHEPVSEEPEPIVTGDPDEHVSIAWLNEAGPVQFVEMFSSDIGISGMLANEGWTVSTPVDYKTGYSFSTNANRVRAFNHVVGLNPQLCFMSMQHVNVASTDDKNCYRQQATVNLCLCITGPTQE